MRRRDFLAHSVSAMTIIALGPALPSLAQEVSETIEVYPPGPAGSGSSIYDPDAILELDKLMASFMRAGSGFAAGVLGSVGAGFMVAGAIPSDPVSTTALLAVGGAWILGGAAMAGTSWLWGLLADDPPRGNYKVPLCQGGMIRPDLALGRSYPATAALLVELDRTATATRHVWDGVELWQGARNAGDRDWMQRHYDATVQAYAALYASWQRLAGSMQAAYDEARGTSRFDFDAVLKAAQSAQGMRLGNVDGVSDLVQRQTAGLACQADIGGPSMQRYLAQGVGPAGQRAMDQALQRVRDGALRLPRPV